MSKARKCDRCHNYYDPYKSKYLIMGPDHYGVELKIERLHPREEKNKKTM